MKLIKNTFCAKNNTFLLRQINIIIQKEYNFFLLKTFASILIPLLLQLLILFAFYQMCKHEKNYKINFYTK